MVRIRNSTCDCGNKVTKEKGNIIATRSKLKTRLVARQNGDKSAERNGRSVSLRTSEELNILVDASYKVSNKSFDVRNSSVSISKANTQHSTRTHRDNNSSMVVTNGNARRSSTTDADENINVGEEGNCVDCKSFRSSKKCDGSSKTVSCKCKKRNVGESGKELRGEEKQNGDYEGRDNNEHSTTRSSNQQTKKCTRSNSNGLENGVGTNGGDFVLNGHANGRENGKHKDESDVMDVECGKDVDMSLLCGDKRKRRSRFEEIFDECAEFTSMSDKRRSRRPPENYSPEPSRRLKLEQLLDEKIGNVASPARNRNRTPKVKPVRKYKPKGPIFHYLDLYIKNKDTNNDTNSKDIVVEPRDDFVEPDEPTKSSFCDENEDETDHTLDEDTLSCNDSAPSDLPLQIDVKSSLSVSDCTNNDNLLLTTTTNKLNSVCKKVKPRQLALDAEIHSILGYRCNRVQNEFLVLFHNGTSNWVTQEDNISISTDYEDFHQYSEHDLSTINRLSYYISEYSNLADFAPMHPPSYSVKIPPLPCENNTPSPSICSSSHTKPLENTDIKLETDCTTTPNNELTDNSSDINTSSTKTNTDPTVYHRDLNDLCYYVMSSRHTKLYPFETTKEIVFRRDEDFMHVYLRNTHKTLNTARGIDGEINIRSCEKLIYKLEDCAIDDTCQVVVISGIEEYFALKDIFDKLVKKPSCAESKMYEQDISMLR